MMNTLLVRIVVVALLVASSLANTAGSPNADASATSVMSELTRVQLDGTTELPNAELRGAAVLPDESAVFSGYGTSVHKINTATHNVDYSIKLTHPSTPAYVLDLAVSSDGSRVFVLSWLNSSTAQIDVLSSADLSPVTNFLLGIEGQRLDVPRDDADHFVVSGSSGWIVIDQDTLATVLNVSKPQQGSQGTVSHDGTRFYGQRMNTVSGDAAYAFSIDGSTQYGAFGYGDGGGGMHYTSTTVAGDQVLLFVGDSSISQNSYVLDVDGNHVQTLGIVGFTYGTEGVDGESVVATQNRGSSTAQNSGLSIIKLIKDTGSGWSQGQKLILDDFSTRYAGEIVTAPGLGRYYVSNVLTGEVIVVADGPQNVAPDCSSAAPSSATLWPPNHLMHDVSVLGVTDSDGDTVSINIDAIAQDEAVVAKGSGSTSPDGSGVGTSTASVRAERSGKSDGRFYEITFTATDGNGGSCSATLEVTVPKSKGKNGTAVNSGTIYDSTVGS